MAPSTPSGTPNGTPKSMPKTFSNNLLNMKFMQRAAAASNSSTPASDQKSSQKSSDRPHKRARLSYQNGAYMPDTPTPVTATARTSANLGNQVDDALKKAMQLAEAEEKRKQQVAIDKAAAEAGEEHWVLIPREMDPPPITPLFKAATWNYIEGDEGEETDSDDPESERNKFGFKRWPVMGRTRRFYGDPNMRIHPYFAMPEKRDKKRKRGDDETNGDETDDGSAAND